MTKNTRYKKIQENISLIWSNSEMTDTETNGMFEHAQKCSE